jgi:hypothetical protein
MPIEGHVRTATKGEWGSGSHILESTKGGTALNSNKQQASGTHILKRDEQVRTVKEREQAKDTHLLKSANRGHLRIEKQDD